ncbi:MAG: ABC transporter ATP-binding protein [Candidatus Manganitrophus sp.]|nr:ABC transporter ATP-binding protein [Candidatus Manganitrophus sp.]
MSALLHVSDLKSHYRTQRGAIRAVDGVSFDLARGEVLGIVGESGSGKSTLALSLVGLLDPPGEIIGGEVRLEGKPILGRKEADLAAILGSRIGMLFQSPEGSFNPIATIGNQLREALQAHGAGGREAAARAEAALALVGMPRIKEVMKSYPFELSGGMCQRAALAMVLSLNPTLLIADEPTASLDVLAQAELAQLFARLRDSVKFSMILISHDLGLVGALADRVIVMYAGKIVEEGPVERALDSPQHPYTRGLLASLPKLNRLPADLPVIPGHAPSSVGKALGCAFSPRCNEAVSSCREGEAPGLRRIGPEHRVACIMREENRAEQSERKEGGNGTGSGG